ncbi:alpha/beta hydrolase [Altererythrobacter sp.]|uniref:alpha/beta hydrolase n=1 Tax=Altererythrobacter sp. TaxID=1872480 RepID=UPI003CFEB301
MTALCPATRLVTFLVALAISGCTIPAMAQNDGMIEIEIPAQPGSIPLDTGPLPGATTGESWHSQYGSPFARNVTEATLMPFLPDPANASGAAVIVAPGGGFRTLSMKNEGWAVAKSLAERGVAAFVLKYRLNQTPADLAEFANPQRPGMPRPLRQGKLTAEQASAAIKPQLDDSRAAFALIRSRAGEWGIDPDRIGMIGFSAGAMLTISTELAVKDADPAFLGDIYGPMTETVVAPDAPPLFVALAADDPLFGNAGYGIIQSWRDAGRPVEFHLYEQGGHGFGMYDKTTTSTGWFDAFASWLKMHGFLDREQ